MLLLKSTTSKLLKLCVGIEYWMMYWFESDDNDEGNGDGDDSRADGDGDSVDDNDGIDDDISSEYW